MAIDEGLLCGERVGGEAALTGTAVERGGKKSALLLCHLRRGNSTCTCEANSAAGDGAVRLRGTTMSRISGRVCRPQQQSEYVWVDLPVIVLYHQQAVSGRRKGACVKSATKS